MKLLIAAINGINTVPGDADNWTGKLVTHVNSILAPANAINENTVVAEKIEYFRTALTRWLFQRSMTRKIVKTLSYYGRFNQIHVVVHSNGANAILRALNKTPELVINKLTIISGACPADFEKNGLNDLLLKGQIGRVQIFTAGKDLALKFARLGRILGFGQLGLTGPKNVVPGLSYRVKTIHQPEFGHSTWFKADNITLTFAEIVGF